jgi:hypothetical protein
MVGTRVKVLSACSFVKDGNCVGRCGPTRVAPGLCLLALILPLVTGLAGNGMKVVWYACKSANTTSNGYAGHLEPV